MNFEGAKDSIASAVASAVASSTITRGHINRGKGRNRVEEGREEGLAGGWLPFLLFILIE